MFKEWVAKKLARESFDYDDDVSSGYKFNMDDDDFAEDQERAESELFKVVLRKYPDETLDFFDSIAQRGDAEISALLRKVNRNNVPRLSKEPRHPAEKPEVFPSIADTGYGADGDDE